MIERTVTHSTFVVERVYDASPERVFSYWSDPQLKRRWFAGPEGWSQDQFVMDFRIGGEERESGSAPDGQTHSYHATYYDIVPNERLVYAYEMAVDGNRISVSLGTAELKLEGGKTRLVYTEQGAYLEGGDTPEQREEGTIELLEALGAAIAAAQPVA